MGRVARGVAFAVALIAAIAVPLAASPALAAGSTTKVAPTSLSPLSPPFVSPRSPTQLPVIVAPDGRVTVRFRINAIQALRAAERAPAIVSLHRRQHPLQYTVRLWIGRTPPPHFAVDFSYRGRTVAEAEVNPVGRVTAVWTGALALYLSGRGHYGHLFDSPWVILTFSAMFLLLFFNPRRPWRLGHADALLLFGLFAIPYYLFDHTHFDASVTSVYPLLILVLARMLWLGVRRDPGTDEGAPRWPLAVLALGVLALVATRVALDIADRNVIDVGVASVIGAHAITHGHALYAAAAAHGDTYGPVTYLAYVPFEAIWPWRGVWDYVPAAHAAAIAFDLATTVGLVVLGMRIRAGEAGRRLGLTLAWAWAAYPGTLLGLMSNTNDGLVALLFVVLLLVLTSAVGRGVVLGLAAAAKLFPVVLLPLFALGWRRQPARQALIVCALFAVVVVAAFAPFVPSGGLHQLYQRTIGFQLGRTDLFSLWGLHPGIAWAKTVLKVAAAILAVAVGFVARRRPLAGVAALACAVTVAAQLVANHWFFNYLVWIAPFAFVALFARGRSADGALAAAAARAEPVTAIA